MGGWGVSMFNETAHSVFVRERLLPCRVVVGSIVYTDYVYPAIDPLLADISCLLFPFRIFVVVVVFVLFVPLFPHLFLLFFPTMRSFFFIGHFVPAC